MTRLKERPQMPESSQNPTGEIGIVEKSKPIERLYDAKFAGVFISGPPGAGTSTLAKSLSELTGASLYKAGDAYRQLTDVTERAPGEMPYDEKVDAIVDDRVRQTVIHADKSKPAIVEAQIGAFTALNVQREIEQQGLTQNDEPIIRILLTADEDVRAERVYNAAIENGENVTLEGVKEKNNEREKANIKWWRKIYPELIGKDHPHALGARDAQGRKIYHLEFDNTNLTQEQTISEVLEALREMGLIAPIKSPLVRGQEFSLTQPPKKGGGKKAN